MRGRVTAVAGLVLGLSTLTPSMAAASTPDTADLTGEVFLDLDADGTRGGDEPGRAGVQLTLRTTATILDATMSDAAGNWSFRNVPTGTVTLVVEAPIDHRVTGGTVPGLDPATGEATLAVGEDLEVGSVGLGSPVDDGPDVATTVTPTSEGSDDVFTWELQSVNLGAADAAGPIDVRAVLSAGHEANVADGDGWTCETSTAIVLCTAATDLPAGTALPPLVVTTTPVGDVGTDVTVTGTTRLAGDFDEAPLNDEGVATVMIDGELAAADVDGDGTGDLTTAGASTTGALVAALLALVLGAAVVTTTRPSSRP